MIKKERLEELIEQGVKYVLGVSKEGTVYLNLDPKKFVGDIHEIDRQQLFENLEDVHWYLDFGNITRTETLKLPTWEDFKNFVNQYIKFYHNEYTYILESCFYGDGKETVEINCSYYDYGDNLLKLPLTKENYIEACKLAKKLFLGEEV